MKAVTAKSTEISQNNNNKQSSDIELTFQKIIDKIGKVEEILNNLEYSTKGR